MFQFQSWVSLVSAFIHSKLPQEILEDFVIDDSLSSRYIPVVPCKNEFQILKGYNTNYIISPFVSYETNKSYPLLYCENSVSLKSFNDEKETKNEIMRNGFYSLHSLDISVLIDDHLQFSKITLLDERNMANLKLLQFIQKIKRKEDFKIVFFETSLNYILENIKGFKLNVEKADSLSSSIVDFNLSENVTYIKHNTLIDNFYSIFRKQESNLKIVSFDSIFIEIGTNICRFLNLKPTFGNFHKIRKDGRWTSKSMSISLK